MTIFNSLGSNYDLRFVWEALWARNKSPAADNLKDLLRKKYTGEVHLVYKGREALELALKRLNLPQGSSIAINGFTCYAVYRSVVDTGYKIVYLDIGAKGLNFSAAELTKTVEKNPSIKAVIIQNTLGFPCKIEPIAKLCRQKGIVLIEDLAHSVGAVYANGKEAGSVGDFVVLSFSQDKMIDAISGGALIVRNKKYQEDFNEELQIITLIRELMDRFYPLLTWLIRKTYAIKLGKLLHYTLKKFKLLSTPMDESFYDLYSLSNWYCSLVLYSFAKLESNLSHRRSIAKIYKDNLDKKIMPTDIHLINNSSNLRFPIFVGKRKGLISFLAMKDVYISDIWYDAPVAPKRYLKQTDYQGQCPNAEQTASSIVNLPTHISISESDALEISHQINQWLKSQ